MTPCIAVDHFAGAGGWSVACRWLGILEVGVEVMPAAIRTRSANGFRTVYRDVWAGLFHPWLVPSHRLYIASPPCQSFSLAGKGEGREALVDVLQAIDDRRWTAPASLLALGDELDPKTALVLTPLAHIWAHRPDLVALEQVPQVLPVWRAIARVLRTLGYSAWSGILRSEQYGVPQTRERAILMARIDGPARPPVPTHSRYYSTRKDRIDPGVEKWVSMAEALGLGMTARPSFTLTGGGAATGGYEPFPSGARAGLAAAAAAGDWVFAGAGKTAVDTSGQVPRRLDEPAHTITGSRTATWVGPGGLDPDTPATTITTRRIAGSRGHHDKGDYLRTPVDSAEVHAEYVRLIGNQDSELGGGRRRRYSRSGDAPAQTITGQARSFRKSTSTDVEDRRGVKLTVQETATLQSFPHDMVWRGTEGSRFLQIGNAVPPLLAHAIIRELISEPAERTVWESVFAEVAG